ncbi:nucleotide-binding protein [Craterilacuibacter sinensis]|nr:conjugal transfer protein TraL [Craterilacuibacter sinensis]
MTQDTIHIVLQGKGGVGKSLIASLIAQSITDNGRPLLAIDTDPVNQTLARYQALNVCTLPLLDRERQVNSRAIDDMIEWLLAHDGDSVVDNGATSFIPVTGYLAETGALAVLRDVGKQVLLHSVLVGGQAMEDTLAGLSALLASTDAPVVVWLNEFFGPVEREGRSFTESSLYLKYRARIAGVVTLQRRNSETYGRDLALMTEKALTFEQALKHEAFGTMPRHRLWQIREDVSRQLQPLLNPPQAAAA